MSYNQSRIKAVKRLQQLNPQLILCGSLALILADEMDERKVGDIDFVVNKKDFNKLLEVKRLRKDAYGENEDDNYTSYHGTHSVLTGFGGWTKVDVNFLVFDDDVVINKETLKFKDGCINIQDIDTILHYKKKYNRDKDIKDLENIATKCLEDIIATEPEEV